MLCAQADESVIEEMIENGESEQIWQKAIREQGRGQVRCLRLLRRSARLYARAARAEHASAALCAVCVRLDTRCWTRLRRSRSDTLR